MSRRGHWLGVSFRRILEVAIAAAVAWTFEGGYLLMNRAMCGFVSGYERPVAPESAQELVRMTLAAEFHELQAVWHLPVSRFSAGAAL